MNSDDEDNERTTPNSETWHGLTAFQRDCLLAIAVLNDESDGTPPNGQLIREYLTERKGERVPSGSMYQNLATLNDYGLVVKQPITGRRNGYSLSEEGETLLQEFRQWVDSINTSNPTDQPVP